MKADPELRAVTLSPGRIYLILIWLVVIVKLIMGQIPRLIPVSDVIMCMILGIMLGRLGGIGLRVHRLKMQNSFIARFSTVHDLVPLAA